MKKTILTIFILALLLLSGCSSQSKDAGTPIGEDKALQLVEDLYPLSSPFFTNVKVSQLSDVLGNKYEVTFTLRGHSYIYNVAAYSGDVRYVAVK